MNIHILHVCGISILYHFSMINFPTLWPNHSLLRYYFIVHWGGMIFFYGGYVEKRLLYWTSCLSIQVSLDLICILSALIWHHIWNLCKLIRTEYLALSKAKVSWMRTLQIYPERALISKDIQCELFYVLDRLAIYI